MNNVAKLQLTVLKNHGGIFTHVQPKKWSEKLTDKLLQAYDPKEKSYNLCLVILEFAALTDGINIVADMCYILEGVSAIILRSDEVLKRLEHVIEENYKWSLINRFFDDNLGQILKRRDTFLHQKHIYSTKIDTIK